MDDRYNKRRQAAKKHYERAERQGKPLRKKKSEMRQHREPSSGDRGGRRTHNREIAEDTLARLEDDAETWSAYEQTVFHQDVPDISRVSPVETPLRVEVWRGSTTLQACQRLVDEDPEEEVCALNFASAKNPGGGFLKGSSAQEESLCRSSGLYYCIESSRMYQINQADNRHCMYHNMGLYSPKVPVIKDDEGLSVPRHHINFITCPAVNAMQAIQHVGRDLVLEEMSKRIDLVLAMAAHHGQRTLVLGAFGCGVFGNDSNDIAGMFHHFITRKYAGLFTRVVFAVLSEDDVGAFDSQQW
jgi:uncharacterized protein (TIGR02452 family)